MLVVRIRLYGVPGPYLVFVFFDSSVTFIELFSCIEVMVFQSFDFLVHVACRIYITDECLHVFVWLRVSHADCDGHCFRMDSWCRVCEMNLAGADLVAVLA